jgi:Ca2+-binding RTX toxin-like protein
MPIPVAISNDVQITSFSDRFRGDASIQALKGGGYVVMWTDYQIIYRTIAQVFDAEHNKVGAEIELVAAGSISNIEGSVTALDDGGFVVIWSRFGSPGAYEVVGQRFDATGQAVGSSFAVNTETSGWQRFVSSATLSDGSFVVTWSSDGQDGSGYGIYAQRFSATGTAIGSEFRVNTETQNPQLYGAIAALSDGGFVITWTSGGQDGSGTGVYGQRYTAAGTAVGAEFRINTHTHLDQYDSSVAALAGGGFVVTWTSNSTLDGDGSGRGIFGQRFTAAGVAVGDEFQVNVVVTNDQSYSSALALQDGGFLVSWQSLGEDGDAWGIFARRYDANGTALGTAFQVNENGEGNQYHNRQVGGSNELYDNSRNLEQLENGDIVFTWVLGQNTNWNDIEARVFTLPVVGTELSDQITGTARDDIIYGLGGADMILGLEGNDTLFGGDGTDTLIGGDGDDFLYGGATDADLRDVIYGGEGNDTAYGGAGNDQIRGDAGNDLLFGETGADTLIGGTGNDTLNGGSLGDLLFGGAGDDFLNGGFGFDRLNGGAGADTFFHLGVADHGSDWIQDYNWAQGDVLMVGIAGATRAQFQVNSNFTPNAGADDVPESFLIYRPTGQILFALIDGAGQDQIRLQIDGQMFDLSV